MDLLELQLMKKVLTQLFFASIIVFIGFLVFYYSIDRLYILRFNFQLGKMGNVVYSPPRLADFFIANILVGFLSFFFLITTKFAEYGERKFGNKEFKLKLKFKNCYLIPLSYILIFLGGLSFTSYHLNNINAVTPVLNEEKILNLINQYRQEYKKPAFTPSDFSCQIAEEKLRSLRDEKMTGLTAGGEGFKTKNDNLYAFNYIKNVGREKQVLFWWQQNLDLNKILQITNVAGTEITHGCVRTTFGANYSIAVFAAAEK
jgi:hypothetical protein